MKKMKFLILIVSAFFLATGCDNGFMAPTSPPNNEVTKSNTFVKVKFKALDYKGKYFKFQNGAGWDGTVTIAGINDGVNYGALDENWSSLPCVKIEYEEYSISVDAKYMLAYDDGTKFSLGMKIYEDSSCKNKITDFTSQTFTVKKANGSSGVGSNKTPNSVPSMSEKVSNLIGGESEYCNTDMNGNLNILNESNLFVNVAYSQVGYKEKATNKSTATCTENIGDKNYQKYGNNGQAWSTHFVHWVLNKAKIKNSIPTSMSEMIDWAKKNNRWATGKNSINSGDLVVLATGSGTSGLTVGILYKENNNWYTILGNWNNGVESKLLDDVTKNAAFYGVIKLKGITY